MDRYRGDAEWREQKKEWHRKNERKKRADPVWNAAVLAKLKERRATDPEWRRKTLDLSRAGRLRRVGRELAIQARQRAKRDGREFTLDPSEVQRLWEASHACAYCGVETEMASKNHAANSPTLDRMDQSKGYTPENTVLACFRCNTLKRDATLEELDRLVANLRRVLEAR